MDISISPSDDVIRNHAYLGAKATVELHIGHFGFPRFA